MGIQQQTQSIFVVASSDCVDGVAAAPSCSLWPKVFECADDDEPDDVLEVVAASAVVDVVETKEAEDDPMEFV